MIAVSRPGRRRRPGWRRRRGCPSRRCRCGRRRRASPRVSPVTCAPAVRKFAAVRAGADVSAAAGEERGQPGARRRVRRARPVARVPDEVVAGERVRRRAVLIVAGRDRIGREAEVAQRPDALVDGAGEHARSAALARSAPAPAAPPPPRGGTSAPHRGRSMPGAPASRGSAANTAEPAASVAPLADVNAPSATWAGTPVADQRVQRPHRRRRVQLERVAVGGPGLDAAGQPVRPSSTALTCGANAALARDRHDVGAPQVAVAPRGGRRVEDRDAVRDVDADPQRRVGQPAARLVHPDDVRALRERLAAERVVLLELGRP